MPRPVVATLPDRCRTPSATLRSVLARDLAIEESELAPRLAAIEDYLKSLIPMKRHGHVDEIARVALFLASTDSSFMTGGEIVVDGGLTRL